jgi:PEP-CTERM motif
MRRWMIGAVMALGIVAPAKASVITTGTYQVTEVTGPGLFFDFTGNLTNIDFSRTEPSFPDYPFVYSYMAFATVNGSSFYVRGNINCPQIAQPGCSHDGLHSMFWSGAVNVGDTIDVTYNFTANWDTDPMSLQYRGAILTAVPEPSTWAMLLIGFAGIGFMARRHGRLLITAPPVVNATNLPVMPGSPHRSFGAISGPCG